MIEWRNTLVPPSASIRETIARIDAGSMQIALVVDDEGRLLGTITDGDVRRAILKGVSLDGPAEQAMNPRPTVAKRNEPREQIMATMRHRLLHQIPMVDDDGKVVGIEVLDSMLASQPRENEAVIMAGGLGSRLQPLTEDTPKPMLHIGGKPILETIVESLIDHGLRRFYLAVNYKSEIIKDYFGNGEKWGVSIRYLEETTKLGTAGALSLLPNAPELPLIVMNGDVLTKVNFQHLLEFHAAQGAPATICVREYDIQIPFGVVTLDRQRVAAIDEKPLHRFFVNAGIYVLDPGVLTHVPGGREYDMPALFDHLLKEGRPPAAFPVREYWLDIGRLDDFKRASGEYAGVFR